MTDSPKPEPEAVPDARPRTDKPGRRVAQETDEEFLTRLIEMCESKFGAAIIAVPVRDKSMPVRVFGAGHISAQEGLLPYITEHYGME